MIFARIADFVVKHHKMIVVFWVVLFAATIVANQIWRLEDITSYAIEGFIPKDTESAEADRIIADQFPSGTARSSVVVVVVAQDATGRDVQSFALDLDEMILVSQYVGAPYPVIPWNLSNGHTVYLTHPIRYMMDPTQTNIYGIYRGMAFSLAQNMSGPLRENVTATQGMLAIYYGAPAAYVNTWNSTGDNATAYNAAVAFVYSLSLPPSQQPLALSYLQVFNGTWNGSFSDPRYAGSGPTQRGDGVIRDALPAFLNPLPPQVMPPEVKAMQLNFTQTFNLTNFASLPLVENYTFAAVASFVPTVSATFLQEVYSSLPANAGFTETFQFASSFVRARNLTQLKNVLHLPYDPLPYFFSPDRAIMLMNYGFSKDDSFKEKDGTHPVEEDVRSIRTMISQLKAETGVTFQVYVTGSAASSVDEGLVFSGGEEFIVTMVLVILLIGLYFRSVISPAFPLMTIGVAIFISNLFIFFIGTHFFTISFVTPSVLQTILLAAGTDYSIFLISRYRDERLDGKSREEAVRQSVTWAGESIATSGSAVLVSFAALGLASFPIVKTMGIAIGFAITMAIILSITLIPSILLLVGNKVFWPHNRKMKRLRLENKKIKSLSRRYFAASARFSMRNAEIIVLLAILVSIPATFLVVTQEASYDFQKGVPPTESSEGLNAMANAFGASYFYKAYVVVRFPDAVILPDGNLSIPKMYALENLTLNVGAVDGIKSTQGPVNPEGAILPYRDWASLSQAQRQQIVAAVRPYVGSDNRTARIFIILSATVFSSDAVGAIDQVGHEIDTVRNADPVLKSSSIYVGGATAIIRDVAESTNNDLKLMAAVVAIGLFVILLIVLGSILIPLRAILMILLSITWTLATTLVLFKLWMGLDMIFILPLIVFVLAMGLGMDYDIFIITRIREEVSKGRSDKQAILISISRTGGIISACGIIMAGAFFSLMLSPLPLLREMGFALAFVVLIDSMVVRIYLVPAIMVLAGKYNWWAPKFLQRVRKPANSNAPKAKPKQKKE